MKTKEKRLNDKEPPQCLSCARYYPDDMPKNCALSNRLIVFNQTINSGTTWWIEDCKEYKNKPEDETL